MANGKAHVVAGMISGLGMYAFVRTRDGKELKIGEALVWAGVGGLGGYLADLLEPASSPRHRGVCHSWLMAAGLAWFAARLLGDRETASTVKELILALTSGYGSHLALDMVTPMGLPLIGT